MDPENSLQAETGTSPKHMGAKIWIALCVIALIVLGFLFYSKGKPTAIMGDKTIQGDYGIAYGKEVVLFDAALTVTGDMTIDGSLSCKGTPLSLFIGGKLTVNGKIECFPDKLGADESIRITAPHIEFGKEAQVLAGVHVDIVSDRSKLLSKEARPIIFAETIKDDGGPSRIGPFTEKDPVREIQTSVQVDGKRHEAYFKTTLPFIKEASAHGTNDDVPHAIFRGTWRLGGEAPLRDDLPAPAPPHILNMLFYIDFEGEVEFEDFDLSGETGRDGKDDIETSCDTEGEDGGDAFRLRVHANNIAMNNFDLGLGVGGKGGDARTKINCVSSSAKGGNGGTTGNFKMTTSGAITIANLQIFPGKGGAGGDAVAIGNDGANGCKGERGGDAIATAGAGGTNKKELSALGRILGIEHVQMRRAEGGEGGDAVARGGRGGEGLGCNCAGGEGGNGTALGGAGGDASLSIPLRGAEAHGGNGGNAETIGGDGGRGGSCLLQPEGGAGGKGGNAQAMQGTGGKGTTARGNSGSIANGKGGDGGAGGDGCPPGKGGRGGIGTPIGQNGKDGALVCRQDTSPPPVVKQEEETINAILYHNVYLPVDQLTIKNEAGCTEDHWRARDKEVQATDGSIVAPPATQCGFGKVKENPPVVVPKEVYKVQ